MADIVLVHEATKGGADFSALSEESGDITNVFTFDITEQESLNVEIEWSSIPIEAGANVSDHKVVKPRTASFSGMVSSTTLNKESPMPWDNPNRLADASDVLLEMAKAGESVFVVTDFLVLGDMRISGVVITRSEGNSHSFSASINLVEIIIVEGQSVDIPPSVVEKSKKALVTSEASGGTQTGTEASEEDKKKVDDSFLKQIKKATGGLL